MTSPHTVRVVTAGSVVTLELAGDIDLTSVGEVRAQADAALLGELDTLVVDLSGTTFLDSAGIGALVGLRNAAADRGIALQLTPGPANVMRVLDIVGLTDAFDATA